MIGAPTEIVITGAALITALGLTRARVWEAVKHARCGMRPMSAMESPLAPGKDGGQAVDLPPDFEPSLPREARYLRRALLDALTEAFDGKPNPYPPDRCAIMLGTTLHGMRAGGQYLRTGNFALLQHFLAGQTLQLAARDLAIDGLAATTCSACSSSLGSIALGITLLQSGEYDLVVAGGYDTISEYVYGGFNSLRLVADTPLLPFSKNRSGMKLAEGYGAVVLERSTDAALHHRKPLAAILGWGESADAHHLTQPHPQGAGAARAMTSAIRGAGRSPKDIDLIAAHATGTPDNDAAEYAALSSIFGQSLPTIPVVGFKSHLGHTLGAAGAVELILSMMALEDQTIPPCANLTPDECEFPDLNVAASKAKSATIRSTLTTSLGFGGANTSIVLGRAPTTASPTKPSPPRDVFITGVGVILPGVRGNDALLHRINEPHKHGPQQYAQRQVSDADLEGLLNARRTRRMSEYVKSQLAAVTIACRHAQIADVPAFAEGCSAILGTMHGSVGFSETYYREIVKSGIAAANPVLFAEGVPNAAAAQLSLMLGIKGACQTLMGTRTSGLDALNLATARIATGEWECAIVGASEEYADILQDAYQHCGLARRNYGSGPFSGEDGFVCGAGAAAIILESSRSLERRSAKPLARVHRWASARSDRSSLTRAAADVLHRLGSADATLSSASATWLDRVESAAIQKRSTGVVSAMYGHVPELFSTGPLVGISAMILGRRVPRLLGTWTNIAIQAATGMEQPRTIATIATDFTGCVSGTGIVLV